MAERRSRPAGSSPAPAPADTVPATDSAPGAFTFQEPTATSILASRRRRRTPLWQTLAVWVGVIAVLGAIGYGGWKASQGSGFQGNLTLQTPEPQTIDEGAALAFRVGIAGEGFDPTSLAYSLVEPPEGATIDPATGEFSWTPTEEQGPGDYSITVRAEVNNAAALSDEREFAVLVDEVQQPPTIEPIEEQVVESAAPVSLAVKASDPDIPATTLRYALDGDGLDGATIDPETGRFEWMPGDVGPGVYPVTVRVEKSGIEGLHASHTFYLRIPEPTGPQATIDALERDLSDAGLTVWTRKREPLPGLEGEPNLLTAGGAEIYLVPFASNEAADEAAAKLPPDASSLLGDERVETEALQVYRGDGLIAVYQGGDETVLAALNNSFGSPFTTVAAREMRDEPPPTPEDIQSLLGLLDKKLLFKTKQYPEIRKVFANRFEQEFDTEIRTAFGDDYDEVKRWLDEHTDLKEELFTAINPKHDDVVGALSLFNELKEQFPEKIESYGELAIAVAVTWDRERGAVYEYGHHARRTGSNYGGELLDGVGNFRYFVETEPQMQGRAQFLPWEFLVHFVNHRTPAAERAWSLRSYGGRRSMFGKCYSDVPYDDEMLRTSSEVCRLNGKDYVLPNILQFGGVCAMQADFAARVGKSMGVPAEYVSGESIYGDRHAWVMWVELKNVTRSSIAFTLESHGRYRGDKYYVGEIRDPQTGETITDRDLELRLHNTGINPLAARQARLVMKAYPLLRETAKMETGRRLVFLNDVIDLSPGNEAAWQALAAIPGEGPLDRPDERLMLGSFDRLFRTFANFPDFTWKIFGDMVGFVDDPKQRNQLYQRLVVLYEAAGRPDLACEARLQFTDLLLAEEQTGPAIEGLAYTIKKFPDEGRYVPQMLDKLEAICADVPDSAGQLVRFYTEFLPAIPRTRGDTPSKYCLEMYQRAIALFRENDQPQLAAVLAAELAKIEAAQRR